jgi:hypothetical protein
MRATRAIAGYIGLLLLALLYVTHADAADKAFTANLQGYSSAPASAYINLVLVNSGADTQGRSNICVKASGAVAVKQQVLPTKSDGTVVSTITPRGDITCGGVTGATLYRVEIHQKTGPIPDPSKDPLVAANLYAIDADFALSAASPTSAVPASSSADLSTYALTRPFRILALANFPTTCTASKDRIQRSDPDTAGQVDYVCNALGNGWDLVGDGGGAGSTPDATATVKGKVKLAGDLGGTADLPTVPGLAAKEATANKNQANGYAGLDGSSLVLLANLPSYPESKVTNLVADLATKFIKPVSACNNATTDKLITSLDGLTAVCATDQTGGAGGGITSLNGLNGTTQTFAKADDANMTLSISSSGTTHTFSLAWAGVLAKARMHAATVYNDQANTFGAFLQKFRAGSNFQLGDPTDFTKGLQFDVSALSTATFRQIKVPDFDSTTCQLGSLDGQVCIWDAANQRYAAGDPIISPDQAAATTQSITATGALTAVDVTRHPTVLVTLRGTYGGIASTFEASPDATNYFTAQAVRVDSAAIETTTGTLTNTTRAWIVNTSGMTRFRLNVSAYSSGTGSVTITPLGMTGGPQTVQVTGGVSIKDASGVSQQGQRSMANSIPVVIANDQSAVAISAASLPLPSGAAQETGNLATIAGAVSAGKVATKSADGDFVTLGAKGDARSTATDTTAVTIMQVLKELSFMLQNPATTPVSGTFWQATQPVSISGNQAVNVAQVGGNAVVTPDNGVQATASVPTTSSTAAVSACNVLSAASTNATSCKGSAGNFYGYELYNSTTTVYYLRLYNTSAAPTCSSATGFIRSIPIPPAGAAGGVNGAISNQQFPVAYSTGIGFCITGGSSSTDNTNAATGVFGEIRYK